jgi:alkylhydroperoxidase family enzyme
MAHLEGVPRNKAGLFVRLAYFLTRRKLGRVIAPIEITAHHPRLLRAVAHMELGQEAAKTIDARVKALAQIRAALLIGCPF